MKRTMLIAVVVMGLVFGLVAYAAAVDHTVMVSANVQNVFSMTIDKTAVGFTIADPAVLTTSADLVSLGIKSNKLVDLTYGMTAFTATGFPNMPQSVMSYSVAGAKTIASTPAAATGTIGLGLSRGNNTYTNTYTIQPGLNYDPAAYTSTLVYTALQQ